MDETAGVKRILSKKTRVLQAPAGETEVLRHPGRRRSSQSVEPLIDKRARVHVAGRLALAFPRVDCMNLLFQRVLELCDQVAHVFNAD
jgi:hypothetical protein